MRPTTLTAHDPSRRTRSVGAPAAVATRFPKDASGSPRSSPARSSPARSSRTGWRGEVPTALGRRWRWLRPLCGRVLAAFPAGKPLRRARLAEFLRHDPGFQRACQDQKVALKPVHRPVPSRAAAAWLPRPGRRPVAGPGNHHAGERWPIASRSIWPTWNGWPIARAASGRLAGEPLRHYRYRWVAKASGSLRLIESPKPRLKQIQRRMLDEILAEIPAPRRGPRLPARPVGRDLRRPARRPPRRAQDGPAGLLPLDHGRSGGGDLPHRGLSRGRGPAAGRPVHQHGADRGDAGSSTGPLRTGAPTPGGRAGSSLSLICPRAPRPRRPWPTSAPFASTPGSTAWPARRGPATRAMPTTWSSRETKPSPRGRTVSPAMSPPSRWKRGSRSSIARRG